MIKISSSRLHTRRRDTQIASSKIFRDKFNLCLKIRHYEVGVKKATFTTPPPHSIFRMQISQTEKPGSTICVYRRENSKSGGDVNAVVTPLSTTVYNAGKTIMRLSARRPQMKQRENCPLSE